MYNSFVLLGLCLLSLSFAQHGKRSSKPNIIMLVTDDWGFNDVSWHDHTTTHMPYLMDFIKTEALIIDTHYVYPLCSITRSALITGRYPIRFGLQSEVIENGYPYGLSVFEKLISNDMQENGYRTAVIGKWHLGFHRPDLCPLNRGFDSFHGSLSPMLHYFSHDYSLTVDDKEYTGYDLHIQDHAVKATDEYLSEWETEQFMEVTSAFAEKEDPFFIYLALHASHFPFETTKECLDPYLLTLRTTTTCMNDYGFPELLTAINSCDKRIGLQAVSTCGDIAIQAMFEHLKSLDIWSNTLIIGISDNGANILSGDNYPLRGGKKFLFEGGVRTPAFVCGGYLNSHRYGKVFDSKTVIHVTDWYPTILSIIGLSDDEIFHGDRRPLDGKNMWNAIQNGVIDDELSSEVREFLYNTDNYECPSDKVCGAYRYGRYKIISASNVAIDYAFWTSTYAIKTNDDGIEDYLGCGSVPSDVKSSAVDGDSIPCGDSPCLFDIIDDPCEYYDISSDESYSDLYQYMYHMLLAYDEISTTTLISVYESSFDAESDPILFRGFWMPWMNNHGLNRDKLEYEFEEVLVDKSLQSHAEYTDVDVSSSEHYSIAMEYRAAHESMLKQNAMLSKSGSKMSAVQFETELKWISFVIAFIVFVGGICLAFKWYSYCLYGTLDGRESEYFVEFNENEYIDDVVFEKIEKEFLVVGNESSEYDPLLAMGKMPYPKSEPTMQVQKKTVSIYPKNVRYLP